MKDIKTWDYLPGTDIYLSQRRDMFRMNTDTALLGNFMRIEAGDRVLDIGTNNGALLLYANRFHPGHLTGVDIQEEACALARENLAFHHVEHADVLHGDILKMKLDYVDVVICNPPYFKVSDPKQMNDNKALSYARHEVHLKLSDLCVKVAELLQENGRFYMVHRADRIIDIVDELRKNQLEIKKIQFVYDENVEDARGVLIEAIKAGNVYCTVLRPQIITR